MKNIRTLIEGDDRFRVDLTKPGTLSRTGKSLVIGSTEGTHPLVDSEGQWTAFSLNCNLFKSLPQPSQSAPCRDERDEGRGVVGDG